MPDSIVLSTAADTRQFEQDIAGAVRRIPTIVIPVKVQNSPLGRITGEANEFNKSLEASNARLVAFGAGAVVLGTISEGLRAIVDNAIKVNKALTDINAIVGLSDSGLKGFSDQLFTIAQNTGQSFDKVAEVAQNFARQTSSVPEILKRTNDALILTRLTGLEVSQSFAAITASIATFKGEVSDSTTVINKLIAADVGFAVSAKDLAEGITRSASSAKDAKVSFDELLAIITSVQATTQRGGAVIGNALKSIFTRIDRPETLNQLEALGIGVRNVQGQTVGAIQILTQLAQRYDSLTDAQKSTTAQLVGGVYNINVLKAALGDLSSQYSIYNRALSASVNAQDAAINRNALLNKSYSSLINSASVGFTKLSAAIGNLTISPALTKVLSSFSDVSNIGLDSVNKLGASLPNPINSPQLGTDVAKGFLKGIGDYIAGPGLVLAGVLALKFFGKFASFAADATKNVLNIGSIGEAQARVQNNINELLQKQPGLYERILNSGLTRLEQEREILTLIQAQSRARELESATARNIGGSLFSQGLVSAVGSTLVPKAQGFIPNFLVEQEQTLARNHGYNPGAVIPFETKGENSGLTPSQFIQQAGIGKASGFVPNFANSIVNTAEFKLTQQGSNSIGIIPPTDAQKIDPIKASAKGFKLDRISANGFIPNFKTPTIEDVLSSKYQVGNVNYDNRVESGIGASSFTQDANYFGATALIHPRSFLNLAHGYGSKRAKLGGIEQDKAFEALRNSPSYKFLSNAIEKEKGIASPYLLLDQFDDENPYQITGHEGRHRALAALDRGEKLIPTVLKFGSNRAKSLSPDLFTKINQKGILSEEKHPNGIIVNDFIKHLYLNSQQHFANGFVPNFVDFGSLASLAAPVGILGAATAGTVAGIFGAQRNSGDLKKGFSSEGEFYNKNIIGDLVGPKAIERRTKRGLLQTARSFGLDTDELSKLNKTQIGNRLNTAVLQDNPNLYQSFLKKGYVGNDDFDYTAENNFGILKDLGIHGNGFIPNFEEQTKLINHKFPFSCDPAHGCSFSPAMTFDEDDHKKLVNKYRNTKGLPSLLAQANQNRHLQYENEASGFVPNFVLNSNLQGVELLARLKNAALIKNPEKKTEVFQQLFTELHDYLPKNAQEPFNAKLAETIKGKNLGYVTPHESDAIGDFSKEFIRKFSGAELVTPAISGKGLFNFNLTSDDRRGLQGYKSKDPHSIGQSKYIESVKSGLANSFLTDNLTKNLSKNLSEAQTSEAIIRTANKTFPNGWVAKPVDDRNFDLGVYNGSRFKFEGGSQSKGVFTDNYVKQANILLPSKGYFIQEKLALDQEKTRVIKKNNAFNGIGADNYRYEDNFTSPEYRVHIITDGDGVAKIVPNATFRKDKNKKFFGSEFTNPVDTPEIAEIQQTALDRVNQLPLEEKKGVVFAPDVSRLANNKGFAALELNPSVHNPRLGGFGSSGGLQANLFVQDAVISFFKGNKSLLGRIGDRFPSFAKSLGFGEGFVPNFNDGLAQKHYAALAEKALQKFRGRGGNVKLSDASNDFSYYDENKYEIGIDPSSALTEFPFTALHEFGHSELGIPKKLENILKTHKLTHYQDEVVKNRQLYVGEAFDSDKDKVYSTLLEERRANTLARDFIKSNVNDPSLTKKILNFYDQDARRNFNQYLKGFSFDELSDNLDKVKRNPLFKKVASSPHFGEGFVPNFAPIHDAISREASFGKTPVIGSAPELGIPVGVYNTEQQSKYGNLSNTIKADHLGRGQTSTSLALTGSGKETYVPNFVDDPRLYPPRYRFTSSTLQQSAPGEVGSIAEDFIRPSPRGFTTSNQFAQSLASVRSSNPLLQQSSRSEELAMATPIFIRSIKEFTEGLNAANRAIRPIRQLEIPIQERLQEQGLIKRDNVIPRIDNTNENILNQSQTRQQGAFGSGFIKSIFAPSAVNELVDAEVRKIKPTGKINDNLRRGILNDNIIPPNDLARAQSIDQVRSERRFQGLFGLSFVAPVAAGTVGQLLNQNGAHPERERVVQGVGSAVGTFAQFAAFGPLSAVAGGFVATLQLLDTSLKASVPNFEDLSKSTEEYKNKQKDLLAAGGDYIESQQNYSDAVQQGASQFKLEQIQKQSVNALGKVDDPELVKQLSSVSSVEDQLKVLEKFGEQSEKNQNDKKFVTDLTGFRDKFNDPGLLGSASRGVGVISRGLGIITPETISAEQKDNIKELAKEYLQSNRKFDSDTVTTLQNSLDPKQLEAFYGELHRLKPEMDGLVAAVKNSTETLSLLANFKNTFSAGANQGISGQLLNANLKFNTADNQLNLVNGLINNRKDFTNSSSVIDFDFQTQSKAITNRAGLENTQALGETSSQIINALKENKESNAGDQDQKTAKNILEKIQSGELFGEKAIDGLRGIQNSINKSNTEVYQNVKNSIDNAVHKLADIGVNTENANQKLADSVAIQKDLLSIQNAQKAFGGIDTLLDPRKFKALTGSVTSGLNSNIQTDITNSKLNTQARRESFGTDFQGNINFQTSQNQIISDNSIARRSARDSFSTLFPQAVNNNPKLLDHTFGQNGQGDVAGRTNQISKNISDIINGLTRTKSIAPNFVNTLNKDTQSSLLNRGGIGFAVDRLKSEAKLPGFRSSENQAELQNAIRLLSGYSEAIGGTNKSSAALSQNISTTGDKSALPRGYVYDKESGIITKISSQPGSKTIADDPRYKSAFGSPKNLPVPKGYVYDPESGIISNKNAQPGSKTIADDPRYKTAFDLPNYHGNEKSPYIDPTENILISSRNRIGAIQNQQSSIADKNQPIDEQIKSLLSSITTLTTGDLNVNAKKVVLDGADLKSIFADLSLSQVGIAQDKVVAAQNAIPANAQSKIDFYTNGITNDQLYINQANRSSRRINVSAEVTDIESKKKDRNSVQSGLSEAQTKLTQTITDLRQALTDAIKTTQDNPVQVEKTSNLNLALSIVDSATPKGEFTDAQKQEIADLFKKLLADNVKQTAIQPAPPTKL